MFGITKIAVTRKNAIRKKEITAVTKNAVIALAHQRAATTLGTIKIAAARKYAIRKRKTIAVTIAAATIHHAAGKFAFRRAMINAFTALRVDGKIVAIAHARNQGVNIAVKRNAVTTRFIQLKVGMIAMIKQAHAIKRNVNHITFSLLELRLS